MASSLAAALRITLCSPCPHTKRIPRNEQDLSGGGLHDQAGSEGAVPEIIQEHASKTLENEEGCIQFEVCDPVEGGNRVFLYEMYADDAAFEVHKASPTLARTRERYADIVESRDIHVCNVL